MSRVDIDNREQPLVSNIVKVADCDQAIEEVGSNGNSLKILKYLFNFAFRQIPEDSLGALNNLLYLYRSLYH